MNIHLPKIYDTVILFSFYSFIGWILEVLYRSYNTRRFVNAGFLAGPFVPIYGFGAFLVLLMGKIFSGIGIVGLFVIFTITLSALEYAVGYFTERYFQLQLWDYTDNRFNLHGRICLLYSIIWGLISTILVLYIHPDIADFVEAISSPVLQSASLFLAAYMGADFSFSVISLRAFQEKISYLYSNYRDLSNAEIEKAFRSIRRLVSAFPDLNKYVTDNFTDDLKKKIDEVMGSLNRKFLQNIRDRQPEEKEYYVLVKDILENENFLKLRNFFHHNGSIYDHVCDVSYVSYRLCKYLKLDYRSAARGGLLHDFFLYDWRDHDEPDLAREKFHGLWHPRIAYRNARKEFDISKIEKDIILKHMWPLTPVPPKYRESYVVTFVDKYLSSREFFGEIKKGVLKRVKIKTEPHNLK